jgi:hypothetical protein
MQTTIQHSYAPAYLETAKRTSLWKRFIGWCEGQEENRFGWTAFTIAGHGCVFTILTVVAVLFSGNHFIFWPFVIGAMAVPLVVNLAAMPTRITIPVLFLSVLVDLVIIAIAIVNGFDMSPSYR